MQRSATFQVRDGREFEHLFPRSKGKTDTISRDADLSKTLEVLPEVVAKYNRQVEKVARRLQGKTRRECAENIWEFCYWYFRYREDEKGKEQIRTPARAWADRHRGIDCDCFTVLISSLLMNMRDPPTGKRGIAHQLRVTKYPHEWKPDPPFSHIYVIMPDKQGHLIIDPVLDRFNYEAPFIEKIDLTMQLEVLNGPPGIDQLDLGLGLPRGGTKFNRLHRDAAKAGITVEELIERNRQKFEQDQGKTVEQFEREVRDKISAGQAESRAREEEAISKLKAELAARGVKFKPDASRAQLLEQIRMSTRTTGASNVINKINKANPATLLLRQGLLLAMKKNMLNVAAKMRFALVPRHQALRAGMEPDHHDKVKGVWAKLKTIFHNAGGEMPKLVAAVQDGASGSGLAGLGEPASAGAAIAAATVTISTLAALVKSVKVPDAAQAREAGIEVRSQFSKGGGEMITVSTGIDSTDEQWPEDSPPAEPKKKGIWAWVKRNKFPVIGGGLLLLGGGGYAAHRAHKSKKKKPTRKSSPAKKSSPAAKSPGLGGTTRKTTRKSRPAVRKVRIK